MELVTRFQIMNVAAFVSLHTKTLRKGMNSTIFSTSYAYIVGKTEFCKYRLSTYLAEGNLYIQSNFYQLKI